MSENTVGTEKEIRDEERTDPFSFPAQEIFTTPSIFEVTDAVTINRADFDALVSSGQSHSFSWACIGIMLSWIVTMIAAFLQNCTTEMWHWKILVGIMALLALAFKFEEPIAAKLAKSLQTKRYKVLTKYSAQFERTRTRIMARSNDIPDDEQ